MFSVPCRATGADAGMRCEERNSSWVKSANCERKRRAQQSSDQMSHWINGIISYLRHGKRCGWVIRVEKSDKVQVALERPSAGISGSSRWIPLTMVDSPKNAMNNPAHAKWTRRDRSPSVEIAWGERSGSGKRGSSAKSGEQE